MDMLVGWICDPEEIIFEPSSFMLLMVVSVFEAFPRITYTCPVVALKPLSVIGVVISFEVAFVILSFNFPGSFESFDAHIEI